MGEITGRTYVRRLIVSLQNRLMCSALLLDGLQYSYQ